MKVGFFNRCLSDIPLDKLAVWAYGAGFEMIDLECLFQKPNDAASTPGDGNDMFLHPENFDIDQSDRMKEIFTTNMMGISSLAYYETPLSPNQSSQDAFVQNLFKVIQCASLLGVPFVSFHLERDVHKSTVENIHAIKDAFQLILEEAHKQKITILIENDPLNRVEMDSRPMSLAFNPIQWDHLFTAFPNTNWGINFNPSHFYWLGLDIYQTLAHFKDRIRHIQAKDAEILRNTLSEESIYGQNWWRYRIPGFGEIDWNRFIALLFEIDYDGVISIELDDLIWKGNEKKIKKGLILSRRHLSQFII